jgi:hypothetical protein
MRVIVVTLLGLALIGAVRVGRAADAADASARVAAAAPARGQARDRLDLDATAITGTRELPKVMSIVPWKAAEPAAGPDRPMGSLIEELLTPLDRDEFLREITYWRDLTSQSSTPPTVAAPGASE